MKKLTAILLLAALLLSLCACASVSVKVEKAGEQAQSPSAPGAPEAEQSPAESGWNPDIRFETTDLSGETWTDACFSEHKLTMINLWAYWCGPCMAELPDLQKLSEDYADRGLLLLGLCDPAEQAENTQALQNKGVTYPCLLFTDGFADTMATGYIPTTIFVDSEGKLLGEAYVGGRSYDEWAEIVEEYLK